MSAGERLVTVLTTLVVPEEADPDDAAALLALAAESTALQVVQSVGVEGHLPVPGATVVRGRSRGRGWWCRSGRRPRCCGTWLAAP